MRVNVFHETLSSGFVCGAASAVRMVPVHQGIVEANSHSLLACGIHIFTHEITPRALLWRTIIRGFGIEMAKAFVMFGGHHHVAHAGFAGELSPFAGRERLWVELFRKRS